QVADLLTAYQGLGVFTGNGFVRERAETSGNWYVAGFRSGGFLTEAVFGYALAVFAFAPGEPETAPRVADLRPDGQAAGRQGLRFLAKTGDVQFTPAQYRGEEAADLTGSLEAVSGDLSSPSSGRRVAALWELRRRGAAAAGALEAIAASLRDKEIVLRREAALTLMLLGSAARPAAPAIADALERERAADVRQLLVAALGRAGAEAGVAVPALLAALESEAPGVVTEALRGLGRYASDLPALGRVEEVAEAARRLTHHPDYDVAEEALRLLARLGSAAAETVPEALDLLRGDCKVLRPALLRLLGRAGVKNKGVLAALRARAKAPERLAAAAAYGALADLGPAARGVFDELPEPGADEPLVRVARAAALARARGRATDAVPVFRDALADDPETLPAIAGALGEL